MERVRQEVQLVQRRPADDGLVVVEFGRRWWKRRRFRGPRPLTALARRNFRSLNRGALAGAVSAARRVHGCDLFFDSTVFLLHPLSSFWTFARNARHD